MFNRNDRSELRPTRPSQSTTPKKRKMNSQPKFYAVKVGHTPGVYLTWQECEQNITKFKNALFRTFPTHAEAEAFVAGHEPVLSAVSSEDKYYGVAVGRKPGVYTDWSSAQEQIVGWKGPKYKKFGTRNEAEAFVRGDVDTNLKTKPHSVLPTMKASQRSSMANDEIGESFTIGAASLYDETDDLPAAKKAKRADIKEGSRSKSSQPTIVPGGIAAYGLPNATLGSQKDILSIYTDGSSLGNGRVGAKAGVGVYFGKDDLRNIAERLQGVMQTNQRAELTAVLRALEIAPTHQETHIYTDSRYSIDCVTVWYKNWERNEWQTSLKKPVLNRDLVQGILAKIREREARGAHTKFVWIKGHANDPNNEAADRLAVRGAQMK